VPALPTPGATSAQLSSLIAVVDGDTQTAFTQLAEASPELTGAQSLEGLEAGIQKYVGRMFRNQTKVVRK
jgi:hypothetical protein